jgi:hypothetical protein
MSELTAARALTLIALEHCRGAVKQKPTSGRYRSGPSSGLAP